MRHIPANCSRYFDSYFEAISQPLVNIDFQADSTNSFAFNSEFDQSLIRHDIKYCTKNAFQIQDSLNNFLNILRLIDGEIEVVDIGCGQGEFLELIRPNVRKVIGFDPVLRQPNEYLRKEYFDASLYKTSLGKTLFVMRCVLPHIPDPFDFIDKIFDAFPKSLFYIEFQDANYLVRRGIWSQLSHDHVNYFNIESFSNRYLVVNRGFFADGEWAYVLFGHKKEEVDFTRVVNQSLISELNALNSKPHEIFCNANILNIPYLIYGAAGKGTIIAFEMKIRGFEVLAVDENCEVWGTYLENSGVKVVAPKYKIPGESYGVIISNPRHGDFFAKKYGKFQLLDIYNSEI
jgi:SAM-dependent methyltransferase